MSEITPSLETHRLEEIAESLQTLLHQGHFQLAIAHYESSIAPDVAIPNQAQWLYGLALLLNGQEEDAQMTWMMAMMDGDEAEVASWITEIGQILEQNAIFQAEQGNHQHASLIRYHLREILPQDYGNLLHMIKQQMLQGEFTVEHFVEFNIIALLSAPDAVPAFSRHTELLLEILEHYFDKALADEITIGFATALQPHLPPEPFITAVSAAAIKIGHFRHIPKLALPLLELCIALEPENLEISIQMAEMLILIASYQRADEIGQTIINSSDDVIVQVIGSYYRLKSCLNQGTDRLGLIKQVADHESRLNQLIQQQPHLSYLQARRLITSVHLLTYIDDYPSKHRMLQNQVLSMAEQSIQTHWAEPYRRFQARHVETLKSAPNHVNRATGRPLRIGYICSCLYSHSVGWLARSLMLHHDQAKFETYIYGVNIPEAADPVTSFYQRFASHYRPCGFKTNEIADQILQDEIDILVDMDSITRDAVCTVMAMKPAPIQATWMGWDAVGMSAIDYYIADPYSLPENAQDYYVEKIWRLPETFLAVDGFEVGIPTLHRRDLDIPEDAIVFLNPQRGYKLTPETLKLQLEILKATPNSYLLLKGVLDDASLKQMMSEIAATVGVDLDRLRPMPYAPSEEIHRANLAIADVILDTFPYNGATTTMEALWMERPIVTLVGQQFSARNSYTMMMNAGITEGISWTPDEYVAWGIRLGTEPELRQQVAWKLRQAKQSAPLWNGQAFTRQMEAAYTQMYKIYIEQQAQCADSDIPVQRDIAAPMVTPIKSGKILVDGVFFQLYRTGIARLWQSLLEEWATDEFSQRIIVLDRNGSCPKIPGIQYRTIPEYNYQDREADRALLQTICDQENASLFISTYYTTPITTPSVFMGYDMIPEVLGWDLAQPMWQSKHQAIAHATAYITISENTAKDLQHYFPQIDSTQVNPILCGVADHFRPASAIAITQFRSHYNIQKPYFLLVGAGFGYKNVGLFIEGLAKLSTRNGFEVICTGASAREISAEARKLMPDVIFHPLYLADDELCTAYSGAVALVYPSQYEGFGLPVVEAMQCGCPVITGRNASLPEVGGEAVIYIDHTNADEMCDAILQVQTPRIRQHLITAGQQQASKFTWSAMAAQMQRVLATYADLNSHDRPANHSLPQVLVCIDWQQPEEQVYESLLRLFQIVIDADQAAHYEFLISADGTTIEAADELVSNAFMQTLMMAESDAVEPTIQLTAQSRANVEQRIVAWLNLTDIQTPTDFFAAMAENASSQTTLVTHNIHGYDLEFPPSHALPAILQRWPDYSSNLGRIAQAVHQKYADLTLIDIGANVGDSVAILRRLAHFPILCIEGDRDFLHVLSRNAAKFDAVTIAPCYVGEADITIAAKSTGLAGTAHLVSSENLTSQDNIGVEQIQVQKLSSVLNKHRQFLQPKMIKTDTDGFDGKILRGSTDVLRSAKPVVFFEYDPFFLAQQDDNGVAIFALLADHGYAGLIIYDNFGDLLLCLPKIELDRIEELHLYFSGRQSQQYCDICAFHQEDKDLFEHIRQSELKFFRNLKSSF
jgi:FkbM family methyltransferase